MVRVGCENYVDVKVLGKSDPKASPKDWVLDTTVNLLGTVEKLCNELVVKDGLLFANGTGLAELEFKGDCLTTINGKAAPDCGPAEPIVAKVK